MRSLKEIFETPVSGYSFAVFRVVFGIMIVIGAIIDFNIDEQFQIRNFIAPEFNVKYTYFEWVPDWPSLFVMKAVMVVAGITGLLVAIGLFYRVAIVVFTLLFTYAFLVEASFYLNHYYFIILLSFLMIFIPANRVWALDARRIKGNDGMVPGWSLWLFKAQIEIVLLYAGLVKIKPDWLQLEPLGTMLRSRPDHVFGELVYQDWFVALGAYGVIILHVVGAPLLYFKRTRLWVFLVYCAFHFMNSYTFYIDFFPYLTILATTLFFEPDWPVRLWSKLRRRPVPEAVTPVRQSVSPRITLAVLFWTVLQVLIPVRCVFYTGDVSWTREGLWFSWRMMLDSHRAYPVTCDVVDAASGRRWAVDPIDYLTPRQFHTVALEPKAILQFARYLEGKWQKEQGTGDVAVFCRMPVSLNGREPELLIDPYIDLTSVTWGIAPSPWIMPMTKPFVHWRERRW